MFPLAERNGKQSQFGSKNPTTWIERCKSPTRVARGIPTRRVGSKIQISITSRPRSGRARTRAREGQQGRVGRCRSCNSHMAEWHQCGNPGHLASVLDYIHSDGGSLTECWTWGDSSGLGARAQAGKRDQGPEYVRLRKAGRSRGDWRRGQVPCAE
jgi:hypothetical protein